MNRFVILCILVFLPLTVFGQSNHTSSLTDTDRTEIVKLIIEHLNLSRPDFEKTRIATGDDVDREWITKAVGTEFKFVRFKHRDKTARRLGTPLHYVSLSSFEAKGEGFEIWVGVRQYTPVDVKGVPPLIRGPSILYFFRKVEGKWEGRAVYSIC